MKTKNKVLIIHNILWSHYKAIVFNELNSLLINNDYKLLIIQIATKGIGQENLGDIDYDLHKYPYKLLFNKVYEKCGFFEKTMSIAREIIAYRPDVVILPGFSDPSYWLILLLTKLLNIPRILPCDSTGFDNPPNRFKKILKKFFVSNCDYGFSYGLMATEYLNSLGMPMNRIITRCQATDNEKIASIYNSEKSIRKTQIEKNGFNKYNFIYVGRLTEIKNLKRLINSFLVLKKSNKSAIDWGLIIVGDGPQKQELINLSTNNGIKSIHFVGGMSWEVVPKFYAMADVFILPSTSEPWGLVVNEAMACSLPVLVSNKCGAAYDLVIEGTNGYTFDPFNENDLTAKLNLFVNNKINTYGMGIKSKEIIDKFTPKSAANSMYRGIQLAIYQQ
jgi:glycosyltransferase involved in cell wall biosynthesis